VADLIVIDAVRRVRLRPHERITLIRSAAASQTGLSTPWKFARLVRALAARQVN